MTWAGPSPWIGGISALALVLLIGWGLRPAPPMDDRPIRPLPPDRTDLSILAFGTSLTALDPWPDQLAARLQPCLGYKVTVARVAQAGAGSAWALAQIDRVAGLSPDIVLIEFTANDADLLDGVTPARSARQHADLIRALQAALPDTRIVLMTMNPVSGLHRLLRARLGRYHAFYGVLADRHGVALVDLNRRWKRSDTGPPPDGLHPTAAQTARIIPPALSAAIAASVGRACD